MSYIVQPIQKRHDRSDFDCGNPFLDDYLRQFARQNHNKGIARAFVLVPEQEKNPVVGYYTLSAGSLAFEQIPTHLQKTLPKYPIPVARIGELAVSRSIQGQGAGSALLLSALKRIAGASSEMAVWAIIVDPIDQHALTFYQKFGFELEKVEKNFLLNALIKNDWNVTRAAEKTGLQRTNFQSLMKKHGIKLPNK